MRRSPTAGQGARSLQRPRELYHCALRRSQVAASGPTAVTLQAVTPAVAPA